MHCPTLRGHKAAQAVQCAVCVKNSSVTFWCVSIVSTDAKCKTFTLNSQDQMQFQWRLCVCLRNLESSLLVSIHIWLHMNNFRWFSTQMFALKYQNYWRNIQKTENIQLPSAPIKDVWRREFWSNLSVCLCVLEIVVKDFFFLSIPCVYHVMSNQI